MTSAATASAILIGSGCVLLERRSPTATWSPGVWDSPGGKLEPGESPDDAVRREIREELGVELVDYELLAVVDEEPGRIPTRCRHYLYVARTWRGDPRPVEGQSLAWVAARWAVDSDDCHPILRDTLTQALSRGLV